MEILRKPIIIRIVCIAISLKIFIFSADILFCDFNCLKNADFNPKKKTQFTLKPLSKKSPHLLKIFIPKKENDNEAIDEIETFSYEVEAYPVSNEYQIKKYFFCLISNKKILKNISFPRFVEEINPPPPKA